MAHLMSIIHTVLRCNYPHHSPHIAHSTCEYECVCRQSDSGCLYVRPRLAIKERGYTLYNTPHDTSVRLTPTSWEVVVSIGAVAAVETVEVRLAATLAGLIAVVILRAHAVAHTACNSGDNNPYCQH